MKWHPLIYIILKVIPILTQDKAHKRYLLMSIDQRQKMLKNLRKTNYPVFEKTCKELGVEYTFPPPYHRKVHRRLAAKKALCIRVRFRTAALVGPAPGLCWRGQREGLSESEQGMQLGLRPCGSQVTKPVEKGWGDHLRESFPTPASSSLQFCVVLQRLILSPLIPRFTKRFKS